MDLQDEIFNLGPDSSSEKKEIKLCMVLFPFHDCNYSLLTILQIGHRLPV